MMTRELEYLLQKVHAAAGPSDELDHALIAMFPGCPSRVSETIDAAVRLIALHLPGFWWTSGYCVLTNDASVYPIGTTSASLGVDHRQGESNELLRHPTMGRMFDEGFHCDRVGGTVPLSILSAFLQAKIAIEQSKVT